MKKLVPIICILVCSSAVIAQNKNVGIGTTNPDPSAALEIKSTDQGLLIPRMDSTARKAILNPAQGLLVFDNSNNSFWYFDGAAWQELGRPQNLTGLLDGEELVLVPVGGDTLKINLSGLGSDSDADSTNELQNLSLIGDTLTISQGNYVVLPTGTIDTDDQTLSLNCDTLSIEDGNYVVLSTVLFNSNTFSLRDGCTSYDEIADAQNTDTLSLGNIASGTLYQTFRAEGPGTLGYIEVHAQGPANKKPVTVTLRLGGSSSGTVLGQIIYQFTSGGWQRFDFSQLDIQLDSGQVYRISLTEPTSSNQNSTLKARANSNNPYPGGRSNLSNFDLQFKVFRIECNSQKEIISLSSDSTGINIKGVDTLTFFDGSYLTTAPVLSISNDTIYLTNGGFVKLPDQTVDTDNQTLSLNGDTLSIQDGNSVVLPSPSANSDTLSLISDADGDTKIQVEKNADEDIVRFDLGGTEYFTFKEGGLLGVHNTANNIGFGEASLGNITTGVENLALGGYSLAVDSSGSQNVAVGSGTGGLLKSGSGNLFLGHLAGSLTFAGNNNVCIGLRSGNNALFGSGNVFIGSQSGPTSPAGDNKLYIDNQASNNPLIYGEFDNDLVRINGDLEVTGSFPDSDDQTLSLNGDTISIQDGNSVVLPIMTSPFKFSGNLVFSDTSVVDEATADFVFGSTQLDDDGNADHYERMFFDKSKAAFRAGFGFNSTWDETNIGNYSFAVGKETQAKGVGSFALGNTTTANGTYAIALGFSSQANATHSFAGGSSVVASGPYAFAYGANNEASGEASVALGRSSTASGRSSTALGLFNEAPSFIETTIGGYATTYAPGDTFSWNGSDRLFTIGNGSSTSNRSNALVMLKNGNTGLGTSTPDTTFHLVGKMKYQDGTESNGYVLTSDSDGLASWQPLSGGSSDTLSIISDADGDTKIQLEKSADEDMIRFDIGGLEQFKMNPNKLEIQTIEDVEQNNLVFTTLSYSNSISNIIPRIALPPAEASLYHMNFNVRGHQILSLRGDGGVKINDAYSLPIADGDSAQVLTTDGNGNMSWQTTPGIIKVTKNLDLPPFGNTANKHIETVLVSGATVGATVQVSPSGFLLGNMVIGYAFVSAPDTVKIVFLNINTVNNDQPAMDFRITVIN